MSTKELLEKSKELKKQVRAGLNKNKSVLTQSRESRAIRQAKLKQIKDEMGMNLLPIVPSIVGRVKKGLSSNEKNELDDLKNKPDMDDDDLQRFSELQEKNSEGLGDDMDEMRENLNEMRDSINQSRQNRIDLRQTDEDTMDQSTDDPTPKRTQPEPQDEDPIEDSNAGNDLSKIDDDDMLESTANKLSEGSKVGEDVGKIGEDVGKVGEELGGEVVAGGGEIDPIQDIIGGLIAVGGAIGSAVSVEEKKARPTAMPVIQQQQTLEGTQV